MQDLQDLRSAIHPEKTLESLDSFSTWVLSLSGVIGGVAALLGVSNWASLKGTKQDVFAAAVVCLALSLALAVVAKIPYRIHVNRWSLQSLQQNYAKIVRFKSWTLIGSGALFAVALILVASAPFF
jgi:hypothetical protein